MEEDTREGMEIAYPTVRRVEMSGSDAQMGAGMQLGTKKAQCWAWKWRIFYPEVHL